MLNFLMKLTVALLILNIVFATHSFSAQIISAALIVVILKIFELEGKLDERQINTIQPKPTETPVLTPKENMVEDTSSYFPDIKPEPVSAPVEDNATTEWLKKILFTGNPMAKIGVVILFIGMTFFIKYVAEHNLLSIEIRHVIVALGGLLLIGIGLRLAPENKNYANTLSGGGVGLLYLTVYSAFHIYHLLLPVPAFALLTVIVVLSGMLAIWQDAKLLALFGILGGFMAPILVSDGSNNYAFLFSYYLVLNVAVLSLAIFKSWWELNIVGFVFTYMISALWGAQSYKPEFFSTTEPFLITFFLFYVAIAILYAVHHPQWQRGINNSFLVLCNPLIVFGLQAGLVSNYNYGIAISAFALCLFYALLATILYLRVIILRELATLFCALAILFGTLTIPYTFSQLMTATNWALESIVLLWWAIRIGNSRLRLSAGLVMIASMMMFLVNQSTQATPSVFFSGNYFSAVFIIAALLTHAYLLYKNSETGSISMAFAVLFYVIGVPAWYLLNLSQIDLYVSYYQQFKDVIVFIASSCMVSWLVGSYLNWRWLNYPAIALLPAMIILSLPDYNWLYYYPAGINLVWLYSFAILYTIMYLHDEAPKSYLPTMHLIAYLFLTWFITDRIDFSLEHQTSLPSYFRVINAGLTPTFMLFIANSGQALLRWPLEKYAYSYQQIGGLLLSLYLAIWIICTSVVSSDLPYLHYLPIINPLDMTIMLSLIAIANALQQTQNWVANNKFIFSVICFIWLNAVLLRTLHHWLDIPYVWDNLWQSMTVQATVSIFWSVIALLVTSFATRLNSRDLWFCGFAIMWVVIIKLFLVDLSDTNTVGRIITFIGVGLLMLINGYVSPLPPKEK